MNGKMSMQAEREVPLQMQRKPVATLNEYTGKPVMKSAHWAYESAAAAAHELPPDGGTKAARRAASPSLVATSPLHLPYRRHQIPQATASRLGVGRQSEDGSKHGTAVTRSRVNRHS